MTSKPTAREEIEARIETLTSQRSRYIEDLSKSEQFTKKCHDDIARHDELITDWTRVLQLVNNQ